MKNFELTSQMLNMRGQFYPTGHVVAMFPGADEARAAAKALTETGWVEDDVSLISPDVMLRDIVRTVGSGDIPLPSAGTEGDTVRRFAQFASQGHWALLIKSHKDDGDAVMQALRDHQVSHAQKYRMLVIEDLA